MGRGKRGGAARGGAGRGGLPCGLGLLFLEGMTSLIDLPPCAAGGRNWVCAILGEGGYFRVLGPVFCVLCMDV